MALSLVSTLTSLLSFEPWSKTTTARHSVSISEGLAKERFVFIIYVILVSSADCQKRKPAIPITPKSQFFNSCVLFLLASILYPDR